jgi:VanZ family protein
MKFFFKIISLVYLILISISFLIPLDLFVIKKIVEVENIPNNNEAYLIHFFIFLILFVLFNYSFNSIYKVLIFCVIYSFIIEIFQIFTSRGFQISDIFFNLIGVFVPFIFFFLRNLINYKKKK